MAFKRVVILGGGPVGLLCAIEAKNYFREVSIIEKRGVYTRLNVPQLNNKLIAHLKTLDQEKKIPLNGILGGASFSQIEKPLLERALAMGVRMLRPFLITSLRGSSEKRNGRYKRISLTIQECDEGGKKRKDSAMPMDIKANLLVIATGGGAADDPLITQTLGFNYEKLKPVNYMAYGIFENSQLEGDVPDAVENAFKQIARQGAICFKTADYQYLLSSLSGISKSDFNCLKQSQELLEQLLVALKRGQTMTAGVRESIKDVKNSVYAFKVNIQRARQLASPEYPAVLVGDAAVTPHPDTGSGYAAGFRGFRVLKTLFETLTATSKADDDSVAFQTFSDQYELRVAKKALEGTVTICKNNIGLLKSYHSSLQQLAAQSVGTSTTRTFATDAALVQTLITSLKEHREWAEYFLHYLKNQKTEQWPSLEWNGSTSDLWKEMEITWEVIDRLTGEKSLLKPQLEALQKAIVVDEILPFSSL